MANQETTIREALKVFIKFPNLKNFDTELISNIPQTHVEFNTESELLLCPILAYLKRLGYDLEHSRIWYYSTVSESKIYCGNDPLDHFTAIPSYEIENNAITIICREAIRNSFGTIATVGSNCYHKLKPEEDAITKTDAASRTKERKIGFIINKVTKWKELSAGSQDENGFLDRLATGEAAEQVGIPKKSLDDYKLQIRYGQKFKFNFQEHNDDKVGVLRAYVKKCKKLEVFARKIKSGEEIPEEIILELQKPGTPACKHNKCCAPGFSEKYKGGEVQ